MIKEGDSQDIHVSQLNPKRCNIAFRKSFSFLDVCV